MDSIDTETKQQILLQIGDPKDLWRLISTGKCFDKVTSDTSFWLEKYKHHGMRNAVDLVTKRPDLFDEKGPLDFFRVYRRLYVATTYIGNNVAFDKLESLDQWELLLDFITDLDMHIKKINDKRGTDLIMYIFYAPVYPSIPWYDKSLDAKGVATTVCIHADNSVDISHRGRVRRYNREDMLSIIIQLALVYGSDINYFDDSLYSMFTTYRGGGTFAKHHHVLKGTSSQHAVIR